MLKTQHEHSNFLSVIIVYGIIISQYYAFVFIFLPNFLKKHGIVTYFIGSEFTLLFIFLNVAYIMIQYTKPGYSPKDLAKHYHERTLEDIKQRTKNITKKINLYRLRKLQKHIEHQKENNDEIALQSVLYCFKCDNIKLPRTHHCKKCNKCILRKDRHCNWVNNCIGLKNHRYYCQFIFYALLCMIQFTTFISYDIFVNNKFVLQELTNIQQILLQVYDFICFTLIVAMGFLLGFHLINIAQNITTIEYHINDIKANNPFRKPRIIDNFKEVFGSEIKYWFLPLRNIERSSFPRTDLFEV